MIHLEHINLVVDDIPKALTFIKPPSHIGVSVAEIKGLGTASRAIGFILAMIINTLPLAITVKGKTAT